MILSLYSYIMFYKQRYNEFSKKWWAWMIATGVSLAMTMSCKMVGLLTFMTVGTAVALDLWTLLDIKRGLSMVSDAVAPDILALLTPLRRITLAGISLRECWA